MYLTKLVCFNKDSEIFNSLYTEIFGALRLKMTPPSVTHTHTHTCWFLWFMGTLHRRNGFYTEQIVCAIALHLPYT